MATLLQIIEQCERENRVCPKPIKWNDLWNLLKNKKRNRNSWIPSLPLILAAWDFTSDFSKKERLIEHLKWAEEQNQLDEIFQYLNALNESDWHHKNE
jgi:hypothetical protein